LTPTIPPDKKRCFDSSVPPYLAAGPDFRTASSTLGFMLKCSTFTLSSKTNLATMVKDGKALAAI